MVRKFMCYSDWHEGDRALDEDQFPTVTYTGIWPPPRDGRECRKCRDARKAADAAAGTRTPVGQ
jgi:hypothetical protein